MGSFRLVTRNPASSREIQIHWVNIGDSKGVVMPFMQDGTYPPRNFATLGPSELQPPFTRGWIQSFWLVFLAFWHRAGLGPYTSSFDFAESCVFIKQSLPPDSMLPRLLKGPSLSRSYRVILPSSFNIVLSYALVFSTIPPVSVSSTVLFFSLFSLH